MISFWKIAAGKYRSEMSTDRQTLSTSNVASKTTDGLRIFARTISFPHDLQGRECDTFFVRGIKTEYITNFSVQNYLYE